MKNEPVPLVDRHAAIAIHPTAVATPDAARAGAHRSCRSLKVSACAVSSLLVALVLANALIAAVGFIRASVAVSTPRESERHLHPAAYLAVPGHASRSLYAKCLSHTLLRPKERRSMSHHAKQPPRMSPTRRSRHNDVQQHHCFISTGKISPRRRETPAAAKCRSTSSRIPSPNWPG